jgi:hypothetical protein
MKQRAEQIAADLPKILSRMDSQEKGAIRGNLTPTLAQDLKADDRLTSYGELAVICNLISMVKGDIVEIGCSRGMTTKSLALAFPDRTIHAVDWTDPKCLANSTQIADKPKVIAELARSYSNVKVYDTDSKAFSYPDGVGAVFIDAEHTYEAIKADSERAWGYAKKQPLLIIWHDVHSPCFEGPTRYLEECVAQGRKINFVNNTMLAFCQT